MSAEPRESTHAYAVLAAAVACVSFSAIFVRVAAVPGSVSAFYRVLFAAAVAVPWCLWKRPRLPSRKAVVLTLAGGASVAIDFSRHRRFSRVEPVPFRARLQAHHKPHPPHNI